MAIEIWNRQNILKISTLGEGQVVFATVIKYKKRLNMQLTCGKVVSVNNKQVIEFVQKLIQNGCLECVGHFYYRMDCSWILSFKIVSVVPESNGSYSMDVSDIVNNPNLYTNSSNDLSHRFDNMSIGAKSVPRVPKNIMFSDEKLSILHPKDKFLNALSLSDLIMDGSVKFYVVDGIRRALYYRKNRYMLEINGKKYISNIYLEEKLNECYDSLIKNSKKFYIYYICFAFCERSYEPIFGVIVP